MTDSGKVLPYAGEPRRGGSCLDEERMVAFYSGELAEVQEDAVRTHLSECARCLERARDARHFLNAIDPEVALEAAPARAPVDPDRTVSAPRWIAWAAGLLIATGVGFAWLRSPAPNDAGTAREMSPLPRPTSMPPAPSRTWDHLPVPKAAYARAEPVVPDVVWRDAEDSPTRAERDGFASAMAAYAKDDFQEAEQRLTRVLALEPQRSEAHFYRGVCLLLLGKTSDAITALDRAHRGAEGRLRDDALYYLALAYLKAGAPESALIPLGQLARGTGDRRAEAERLQQQVHAAPRPRTP